MKSARLVWRHVHAVVAALLLLLGKVQADGGNLRVAVQADEETNSGRRWERSPLAAAGSIRSHTSGRQRVLTTTTTTPWKPPTSQEFADFLLEGISKAKQDDQAVDLHALSEDALVRFQQGAPPDTDWEQVLNIPKGSAEEDAVIQAALEASHESICTIPGKCLTEEKRLEMVDLFVAILEEYKGKGKLSQDDQGDIMDRIEQEMGLDEKTLDELIERSQPLLADKVLEIERAIQLEELKELEDRILQTLDGVEASNFTDYDGLLNQLNLTAEDAAALIHAMPSDQQRRVKEAMERPFLEMNAKITAAFNDKVKREAVGEDDGGYFEEVEDYDDEEEYYLRGRRLRFVPDPEALSLEDKIRMVEDSARVRRRLESPIFHINATSLRVAAADHLENLHDHIRQLKTICSGIDNPVICVGKTLQSAEESVRIGQANVKSAFDPLFNVVNRLEQAVEALATAKSVGIVVALAVQAATKIPSYGAVFLPIKVIVQNTNKLLKKVYKNAREFKTKFAARLKGPMEKVQKIIASYDPNRIGQAAAGAGIVGMVSQSQCVPVLVHNLTGVDMIGTFKTALSHVNGFVKLFLSHLQPLVDSLNAPFMVQFRNILTAIFDGLKPIQNFLNRFKPLADLMKATISIPWYGLPYQPKQLGPSRCPSGHYASKTDGRLCWEKPPSGWEEKPLSVMPAQFRKKCSSGGLASNTFSGCNNIFHDVPYKTVGSLLQKCPSGFSVQRKLAPYTCYKTYCGNGFHKNDLYCYKNSCPNGFQTSSDKKYCSQNTRTQTSKQAECGHLTTDPGTVTRLYQTSPTCWSVCKSDDKDLYGWCFAPATLKSTIEYLASAFEKIVKFIEGLPIIGQILKAIDLAVDFVLKPIKIMINEFAGKVFGFVDFPGLPDLKFDKLRDVMPLVPDLSKLFDLPGQVWETMKMVLGPLFDGIADCETDDMACILSAVGLDLSNAIAIYLRVRSQINRFSSHAQELAKAFSAIRNGITNMQCKEWGTLSIPMADELERLGLPKLDVCDVELPQCKEWDLRGFDFLMDAVKEPLKAIADLVMGTGRRQLAEGEECEEDDCEGEDKKEVQDVFSTATTEDVERGIEMANAMKNQPKSEKVHRLENEYLRVIKFQMEAGLSETNGQSGFYISQRKDDQDSSVSKSGWSAGKGEEAFAGKEVPIGYNVRAGLNVWVEFGFNITKGKVDPRVKMGTGVSIKAGYVTGHHAMLQWALAKAKELPMDKVRFRDWAEEHLIPEDGFVKKLANWIPEDYFVARSVTRKAEDLMNWWSPPSLKQRCCVERIKLHLGLPTEYDTSYNDPYNPGASVEPNEKAPTNWGNAADPSGKGEEGARPESLREMCDDDEKNPVEAKIACMQHMMKAARNFTQGKYPKEAKQLKCSIDEMTTMLEELDKTKAGGLTPFGSKNIAAQGKEKHFFTKDHVIKCIRWWFRTDASLDTAKQKYEEQLAKVGLKKWGKDWLLRSKKVMALMAYDWVLKPAFLYLSDKLNGTATNALFSAARSATNALSSGHNRRLSAIKEKECLASMVAEPVPGDPLCDAFFYTAGVSMEGDTRRNIGLLSKRNRCGFKEMDYGNYLLNKSGKFKKDAITGMLKKAKKLRQTGKYDEFRKRLWEIDFSFKHFRFDMGFEYNIKFCGLGNITWDVSKAPRNFEPKDEEVKTTAESFWQKSQNDKATESWSGLCKNEGPLKPLHLSIEMVEKSKTLDDSNGDKYWVAVELLRKYKAKRCFPDDEFERFLKRETTFEKEKTTMGELLKGFREKARKQGLDVENIDEEYKKQKSYEGYVAENNLP